MTRVAGWRSRLGLSLALVLALLSPSVAAADPLALARQVSKRDAWLASLLSVRGGFEAGGPGFVSVTARGTRQDTLVARLPARADGTIELRAGGMTRPLARVRQLGARDVAGELGDGHVVYRSLLAGVDAIWAFRDSVLEQALLVREPISATPLRWQIVRRSDLVRTEIERSGALLLVDALGRARLRIPRPYAVDRDGRRRLLELRHSDTSCGAASCTLVEIVLDARGLELPLLIDPLFEEVTWIDRTQAGSIPSPRSGHTLVYDDKLGQSVLFGGAQYAPVGPNEVLGDTLLWDGQQWTDLGVLPGSPAARTMHAMAYDAASGLSVLYGGSKDGTNLDVVGDTWTFDGIAKQWQALVPLSTDKPPAVFGAAMTWHTPSQRVVMRGGLGPGKEIEPSLWWWTTKTKSWTRQDFPLAPETVRRGALSMAPNQLLLELGGTSTFVFAHGETWLFDGTQWVEKTAIVCEDGNAPAGGPEQPCPRTGSAIAYDASRDVSVLFAGEFDMFAVPFQDTWEWDGTSWTRRYPATSPPGRTRHAMTYDAKRERIVLFGGSAPLANGDERDTWEYYRLGGTCTTSAECDYGSCVDGVCCKTSSCPECQACSAATGTCAPIQGDDPDSCSGEQTCSADGACKLKNGGACTSGEECASGACVQGLCCDRACDGACESCSLPGGEGTCSFVTGAPVHGSCPGTGDCASRCDGSSGECAFPDESSDCGSSCSGAIVTRRACNGQGFCVEHPAAECPAHFACLDAAACATSCSDAAQCAPGHSCIDGGCAAVGVCAGELAVSKPDGTSESCGAYRCRAGACLTQCSSLDDCAPGFVCTPDGVCAAAPEGDEDSGCGCRVPSRPPAFAAWWLALAGLVLVRRFAGSA